MDKKQRMLKRAYKCRKKAEATAGKTKSRWLEAVKVYEHLAECPFGHCAKTVQDLGVCPEYPLHKIWLK